MSGKGKPEKKINSATGEHRREPPEKKVNGPHAYRGDQFRNSEYIEWVREEVNALNYDTDERVIVTDGFKELGQRGEPQVVLMTQTSPDRLPFVRRMLSLWNGPATVAVYIPFPKMHPDAAPCAERALNYLNSSIEALTEDGSSQGPAIAASLMYSIEESPTIHCMITDDATGLEPGWLNDHVWQQLFDNMPYVHVYDSEYPVGTLRQVALDLVPDDSFAFLVDADFVLMKDFATKLKQGAPGSLLRYAADAWTERSERHAVIVPAFQREPDDSLPGEEKVKLPNADATHACAPSLQDIEPGSDCWMYNQYDVPLTKDALHRMLDDGSITGFYEDKWPGSHGCYVPSQAIQKEEPFSIAYTHPCEPYVIALKASLPTFDGRWRGRMLDKTSYITHMAAWGFKFHVDPTSFMVHLPHAPGVALTERPEDIHDQVFADFWALPYALTRVFLDDVRHQPEAQCEVLPVVKPLEEEDVVSVMHEDGAKKAWCRDADVSDFDWSRVEKDFAAPHACIAGMACNGGSPGTEAGDADIHGEEASEAKTRGDSSSTDDVRSSEEYNDDDESHPKVAEGEILHVPDTSPLDQSTKVYLREAWNPAQGKAAMVWSAAGVGILAWVLFVWFCHSTLNSRKSRRKYISMQELTESTVSEQ